MLARTALRSSATRHAALGAAQNSSRPLSTSNNADPALRYRTVYIDFTKPDGPFGLERDAHVTKIAQSEAAEPGLVFKLWLEEESLGKCGGLFVFDSRAADVEAFVAEKRRKLEATPGISDVRVELRTVNQPSTLRTFPLGAVNEFLADRPFGDAQE